MPTLKQTLKTKANQTDIMHEATELNYWGKRVRDAKLTVAESIIRNLGLDAEKIECSALAEWLTDNKPVELAKAKVKRVDNKQPVDTMLGCADQKRLQMPVLEGERFIVTSAQNNTAASPVLAQLKNLADNMDAKLVIMPTYYNKAAFSVAVEDENASFCAEAKPYMLTSDVWLGDIGGVLLAVSANVSPTAKQPINSAKMLNDGEAVTVVASPKQDHMPIPVMEGDKKRKAWTTGSCTQYNYLNCRAGAEAEARHKFGALIIEVDSVNRGIRVTNVVQGRDGTLMTWEECRDSNVMVDIALGDLHCERKDEQISQLIKEWLATLYVGNIALHDILHFETASHHNRGSGSHLYRMAKLGKTVAKDLIMVASEVNDYAKLCDHEIYLVESNHNSAIDNWMDDAKYSPKSDPVNSKLYYLLNYALCDTIDKEERTTGGLELALSTAFDYWEQGELLALDSNVRFGWMDKPEKWSNVEMSQHGHKGTNGSMGSTALFGKSAIAMVTGHTHSPAILGACTTVGVSASLKQGYNRGGLSSWDHANAVILPNGTTQLVQVLPTLY